MVRRTHVLGEAPRLPIQTRVAPALIDRLKDACEASGRSMAQEIELRLERSFDADNIQRAVRAALAEDRAQREAEHEERSFAPRLEAAGRQYRY